MDLGCKIHDAHLPVRGEIVSVDKRHETKQGVNWKLR